MRRLTKLSYIYAVDKLIWCDCKHEIQVQVGTSCTVFNYDLFCCKILEYFNQVAWNYIPAIITVSFDVKYDRYYIE